MRAYQLPIANASALLLAMVTGSFPACDFVIADGERLVPGLPLGLRSRRTP